MEQNPQKILVDEIGGMEDDVDMLIQFPATITLADAVTGHFGVIRASGGLKFSRNHKSRCHNSPFVLWI